MIGSYVVFMEKTLHPNLSAPSSPTAPSAASQSGEGAQGGPKTKGAKDVLERFMHLLFLLCGIVAVAFVLCISVYLRPARHTGDRLR